MDKLINDIIKKVRQISKYNYRMQGIVDKKARITVVEDDNATGLKIESIVFDNYNQIVVTNTTICYYPYGQRAKETLFTYNNWKEFLNM